MSHDLDFDHEHEGLSAADQAAIAQLIWEQDTLELRTVGIDIGSSTSHLLFAKITLSRQAQGLSSRFTVVDRQVLWRSPIMLTPFLPDGRGTRSCRSPMVAIFSSIIRRLPTEDRCRHTPM